MVEVKIESIRVSLMSQHRVVILKELESNVTSRSGSTRMSPMPSPFTCGTAVALPLTHDLALKIVDELGGKVDRIIVSELKNDVFYASVILKVGDREIVVDARPSDAVALAVRADCPIFVENEVMDKAGVIPDDEDESVKDEDLGAFKDFLGELNLDDLDKNE
jgi:hypothetical protein